MSAPARQDPAREGFAAAVAALRALVGDELEAVNEEILARMSSGVDMIPALAGHLLTAGGKRVRPMLTLAAARSLDYQGKDHVRLAATVELIHGATLLHDDVVDKSALRRGLATANVVWGNKESVLVGDYIFARAFELMVATGDLKVLKILSAASGIIAEGEVLQLAMQKNLASSFEAYLDVVNAKTAALFAAAARSGAVIAGADETLEEAFDVYGRNLGVAYQIVDDALDYASGGAAAIGKNLGDDFREGKMTAPVVLAYARAREEEKPFWKRTIADGKQKDGDFAQACALMERDGVIEESLKIAQGYADEALEALKKAPDTDYTRALAELVEQSVARAS